MTEVTAEAGEANERASDNERKAAQFDKEAAQLRKDAEAERLARIAIEANVGWRRLNEQQRKLMASRLAKFPDVVAALTYLISSPEGQGFAEDIFASFPPSWTSFPPSGGETLPSPGTPLPTGVEITSPAGDNNLNAANALADQLREFGFDVLPVRQDSRAQWIAVWIGFRPESPQGDAKLRLEAAKKNKAHSNQVTH